MRLSLKQNCSLSFGAIQWRALQSHVKKWY
jgi:hypothetical protein